MKSINNYYELFKTNTIPKTICSSPNSYLNFYHCDSEENFNTDPHPNYINKNFGYTFNNFGYRCDNFSNENEYKILTIGCSISFGVGLPIEETYANILCNKLSIKYGKKISNYNLSANGAGSDYISRILLQTIDILQPNFVIILFPEFSRLEHYCENSRYENVSASGILNGYSESVKHIYAELITNNSHMFFNFVKNFYLINETLKNRKIDFYWNNWSSDFLNGLSDKNYINELTQYISLTNTDISQEFIKDFLTKMYSESWENKIYKARDWIHTGKNFHEYFANYLYEKIVKKNIF